jgi:hypothetical protein
VCGCGCGQQTAVEVSVYNLLAFFWEVERGSVYHMTKPHDVYSGLGESELPRKQKAVVPEKKAEASEAPATADGEGEGEGEGELESKGGDAVVEEGKSEAAAADDKEKEKEAEAEKARARAAEQARNVVHIMRGVKVFPVVGSIPDLFRKRRYQVGGYE